jgi:hypothetical protein
MGFSAIILMGYEVWVGQLQEARRNMFIRVIVARDPRPCMGNGCVEDFSISYTTGFLRVMTIGALTGCNLARRWWVGMMMLLLDGFVLIPDAMMIIDQF